MQALERITKIVTAIRDRAERTHDGTIYKVWAQVERCGEGDDFGNMGEPVTLERFDNYDDAERFMLRLAAQQPGNDLSDGERAKVRETYNEADRCDECGETPANIGTPDGAQICQRCFDAGAH